MLAILYLISHLDRGNIGNANIEGLSVDLGLTGVQYNVALSILFVTYIIFGKCQIPNAEPDAGGWWDKVLTFVTQKFPATCC